MNLKIKIGLALLFLPYLLFSRDIATAVEDQLTAPLTNPAAMGAGNSMGMGYRQSYDQGGLLKDFDLIFSLGSMAYSYQKTPWYDKHLFAAGGRIAQGLYGGASTAWRRGTSRDVDFGLSLLSRPLPFLSLSLKGEDLTDSPYGIAGIGFRPLFFNKGLSSRFTLWTDARWEKSEYKTLTGGLSLEPLDGLKFSGFYNFRDETVTLGAALALGHLETGTSATGSEEDPFHKGDFHFYSSFKKQRSLADSGFRKALIYDMAQTILDAPAPGYLSEITWNGTRSLMDFIRDMEQIKQDSSVKALIFRNQNFQTSFANLLEIETLLQEVRDSGKKIYFYYDSIENFPYTLAASAGDAIYLSPAGSVNLRGFSTSRLYFRDFLADWGILVQNFQSHPYKTAFNNLSEPAMTDQERVTLENLFARLHQEQLRMLARGRKDLFKETPEEILNNGPFIHAARARELGMIDGIYYEDQFLKLLEDENLSPLPYSLSANRMNYDWEGSGKPLIAVIYAQGNIHSGVGIAGQTIGSDSMAAAIQRARNNPMVKAVILRINSGGGSSLASDLIAREVALCRSGKNSKPVIVSMGGSAASGGYYIAAPAEYIIASPGSITGSIGVVSVFPDISGLLEKLKIGSDTVKTAEGADTGSVLRGFTDSERENMEAYIRSIYSQFTSLVVENRPVSEKQIEQLAQGRVWTGAQAVENGLADRSGGLSEALGYAAEAADVNESIRVLEIVPGRRTGFIDRAFPWLTYGVKPYEEFLPEDLEYLLEFYKKLESYPKGEALYLMPFTTEVLINGSP